MSVYIKGMEMPVDCLACRIACDKESYMVVGRPPKCPLAEAPDGDLIGRAETIEAVELMEVFLGERKKNAVIRGIQALPSAEAVQGEWTYLSGLKGSYMTISCPICGSTFDGVAEWKYNYCPNCGAKMKGGDSE